MKWFRLYHDTITDPKWRLVALDSGQPLSSVLAVWLSMLVNASDSPDRGTLHDWNDRIAGAAIDLRGDAVAAIREAMQGLVLDGDRLTGWDKRQRASDNVAERVSKHRKKSSAPDPDDGSSAKNGVDRDGHATNDRNGKATLQTDDVTLHSGKTENVTLHSDPVTDFPLRAQTPDTEESLGKVDSQERIFPAPGAGANKIAYQGLTFSLSAKVYAEYEKRYSAIPNFLVALQSIDAEFHAEGTRNPNARLVTRLLHENQALEKWQQNRAERQKPKTVQRRSGNRVIGGLNGRGAA